MAQHQRRAERGGRRRRLAGRVAAACCVAAIGWGAVAAYTGYQQTAGPDGAVRGYFAALTRGDAAAALAFGAVPDGVHTLLTATVLKEQQRIAPIRGVTILSTTQQGASATVTVRYRLDFAGGARTVVDRVVVGRRDGSWRLAATAASTSLDLTGALERATVVGAAVPDGPVAIFPGALPITFDTAYLSLAPAASSVTLSAPSDTTVDVEVSQAGRAAIFPAVAKALSACFAKQAADPRCPLPSNRVVPGTMRGALTKNAVAGLALSVNSDQSGVIAITGHNVTIRATYDQLDFDNQPFPRSGPVTLEVAATTPALGPVRVNWSEPS